MKRYWISFSAPHQNLGVVLTTAENQQAAITHLKEIGVSPGGEAMLIECPLPGQDIEVDLELARFQQDRLYSVAEMHKMKYKTLTELGPEDQQFFLHAQATDPRVSRICPDHT